MTQVQAPAGVQLAALQACLQTVPASLKSTSALPAAVSRLLLSPDSAPDVAQRAAACYALQTASAGWALPASPAQL